MALDYFQQKKGEKGITPVVSVILLLLITISIVGFAMIFFQRIAAQSGEAGESQLQQSLASASESFEIVSTDGNKVYVKNTGTADLKNLKFYVDGAEISGTANPIAPNTIGEVPLNSAQLAAVPGDRLRITSAGYTQEQPADFYDKNTVAYWRFDEADGRTIKDSSGNGNDGTFSGESWKDGTINGAIQADGKYWKAMSFNGVDDYVTTGSLGIPQNGPATIEGWFYFKDRAKDRGSTMWLYGNLLYQHTSANNLYFSAGSDYFDWVPELNTWYHLVITYSGDTSTAKLYVNGKLYGISHQLSANIPAFPGVISDTSGAFSGVIDEVRIYGRVLTQSEIQDDMNSAYPAARTLASYSFEKFTTDGKAQDTHNIVKGQYGAALSFDGVNDYIGVADKPVLNPSEITIEAWAKRMGSNAAGQRWGWIAGKHDHGANNQWAFVLYDTYLEMSIDGKTLDGTTAPSNGVWYHLAGTYNGNEMRVYLNGKPDGAPLAYAGGIPSGTAPVRIGSNSDSTAGEFFNGVIDEVRILNIALA